MSDTTQTFEEGDFSPGTDCPICGEQIVTYFTTKVQSEEVTAESQCTLPAEDVEPGGIMSEWTGNTFVVDHRGPAME